MLTYNTQQKRLSLPEYGRNIQKMVDHCLTIEDRDERNRCARSIIKTMLNLFPELKGSEEEELRLWDHLAIMSGFELDVDYPDPTSLQRLQEASTPQPVSYGNSQIHLKQYGKTIEAMIDRAAEMDEGEERDYLISLIANHMKKILVMNTHDDVDNAKIFDDLRILSQSRIRATDENCKLHQFVAPPQPVTGKKKKKK